MFSSIIILLKNILLFPIRLIQAIGWFVWAIIFGGLYPGCAPIFLHDDHFILFLKRIKYKYCVVLYDIDKNKTEVLYECESPIEQYRLIANDTLLCSSNNNKLKQIEINISPNGKVINHNDYVFEDYQRHSNVILSTSIGFISFRRICSDNTCYLQFFKTSPLGEEILDNFLIDAVHDISVSLNDQFVMFASRNTIFWYDLIYRKRSLYELSLPRIYNSDRYSNYLINSAKEGFIIINPSTTEISKVNIPSKYNKVFNASISPSGKYIVYYHYAQKSESEKDRYLILLSTKTSDYKVLCGLAHVFAINWSCNERYVSIAGVKKRDLFDISYGYKMRNATNHDKFIVDINDGSIVDIN